jgi:hypothetical protein
MKDQDVRSLHKYILLTILLDTLAFLLVHLMLFTTSGKRSILCIINLLLARDNTKT